MSDHDGHTINVGPITVADAIHVERAGQCRHDGEPWPCATRQRDRARDEVDRLRAENAALAAALNDIAGMRELPDGTWVADAECMNMRGRCWEHLGKPDGGPDEWCHTCVAEVAWSAWKLGVLR